MIENREELSFLANIPEEPDPRGPRTRQQAQQEEKDDDFTEEDQNQPAGEQDSGDEEDSDDEDQEEEEPTDGAGQEDEAVTKQNSEKPGRAEGGIASRTRSKTKNVTFSPAIGN